MVGKEVTSQSLWIEGLSSIIAEYTGGVHCSGLLSWLPTPYKMVISFWRFERCKLLKQWISNFKAHLLSEQPWPLEPQQGPSTLALTLYNDHTNLRLSMVRMIRMVIMVSIYGKYKFGKYKFGKYGKNGKYGKYSKYGKHGKYGKYSQYSKYNKYAIQLLSLRAFTYKSLQSREVHYPSHSENCACPEL